jgi:hypothetical protein
MSLKLCFGFLSRVVKAQFWQHIKTPVLFFRSADEMKPLDSPFQSRKDRDSLDKDENEPVEAGRSIYYF